MKEFVRIAQSRIFRLHTENEERSEEILGGVCIENSGYKVENKIENGGKS
jgi:hypothetical protein